MFSSLEDLRTAATGVCGVLLAQGIVGSVPWTALVFLTLYLQLLGMSDFAASMLMALFLGSTALGGLLGGYVGDVAAARSPHHGRIFATQFSVFIGIPFSLLIFKVRTEACACIVWLRRRGLCPEKPLACSVIAPDARFVHVQRLREVRSPRVFSPSRCSGREDGQ